jgi:uncharacterized protein YegL
MQGSKIQSLNAAISDGLEAMKDEAKENPEVEVKMRVLRFATNVEWEVEQPMPVDQMTWRDLSAGGVTNMGEALSKVADQMSMPPMEERAFPPVLALVSDGQPTDNFDSGLQELLDQKWGNKAVRIAIGIGSEADHDPLERFIGNPEIPVLQANNPEDLTRFVRWASTEVVQNASAPPSRSQGEEEPKSNVNIPKTPDSDDDSDDEIKRW